MLFTVDCRLNCEVFKWVPSILTGGKLITHTGALRGLHQLSASIADGFILNLGAPINFFPERVRC